MIKVSQKTETTKEVTEGFFEDYGTYYSIAPDKVLRVSSESIMVDFPNEKGIFREHCITMIDPKPITEKEFKEHFKPVSDRLLSLAGISNVPTLQLQEA